MDFIFRILTNGSVFKIQQKTDDDWYDSNFSLFNSYRDAIMYLEIYIHYLDYSDKTEGNWEEVINIKF